MKSLLFALALFVALFAFAEARPVWGSRALSGSNAAAAGSKTSTSSKSTSAKSSSAKSSSSKSSSSKSSSSSVASSSGSNSTATVTSSNSSDASASSNSTGSLIGQGGVAGTATSSAQAAARTRPCDQGDQSLAAALQANVLLTLGSQTAVTSVQQAIQGGNSGDVQTAIQRLQQFVNVTGINLQVAQGIADDGSFAQAQLALLATSQNDQVKLVSALTGQASDNSTLTQLAQSFVTATGNSQDGADNALVDCFLPTTMISG